MNKTSIKNYAIWARNELISRVSQKAYEYGVEKENILPYDVQSINGRLLSEDEKKKRQILINEVKHKGYDQVIEEVAYTWFNRFIALRFMEVNNYLPDKVRLFTNENNEFKPQIIDEALHIELIGLDKNKVLQLKESNNSEELYKELLLATCNDMSRYLPGMFKPIDDYMTLLFPSNLLREESVLGRLISDIDEDSWTDQVQIIGWLYQYYNTEPKDTLIHAKNKYKKADIPAVTQLFTPDWIVHYMVDNSLGKLWSEGRKQNALNLNYYIPSNYDLALIAARDNPVHIKFLDPCMGSGHILVYAFDVFMQIYVSEGWTEREAAKSILQNNIYGLDIDERAYQLSYFALMMKARQYNRRILSEGIVPNVMAIEESNTFNKELLRRFRDLKPLAERVVNTFIDAKEYGSILNVEFTKEELDSLEERLNEIDKMSDYGNLLDQMESDQLLNDFCPLLKQARIMSQKYECVVTNPPYMNSVLMTQNIKKYAATNYTIFKGDLFACMIRKSVDFVKEQGYVALLTPYVWMFISTYEKMRHYMLESVCIDSLVQLEYNAFEAACVPVASFSLKKTKRLYNGTYVKLSDFKGSDKQGPKYLEAISNKNCSYKYSTNQLDFKKIPGVPYAFWISSQLLQCFVNGQEMGKIADVKQGLATTDNNRYLRLWSEVNNNKIGFDMEDIYQALESKKKWFPYNKGGDYRKWYGNNDYIVNYENDGDSIKRSVLDKYSYLKTPDFVVKNTNYYFKECASWSLISSTATAFRYKQNGFIFDVSGMSFFTNDYLKYLLAFCNTKIAYKILNIIAPTINFQAGDIAKLPILFNENEFKKINKKSEECVYISRIDWDSFETSWDFNRHPLIREFRTIKESYEAWNKECTDRFNQLKTNEEELNRIFIDIYGLQAELTPEVEDKDITVRKADLQREIKSLISYAVGCMFGRYSLDVEGLAYAGGDWDDSKYKSYIPDKDNIIPICDDEYFNDDITGRFIEFIKAAYGEDTLEENLRFIADALGGKGTSREVIRNYFINDFYKDHCNTYQVTGSGKRPIYWQFDSGKKNGFKALIYIHRYTPDLIARMRTSYVHEQQSRYENQVSMIQNRIDSATSTSERVKAEKEMKKLKDQAEELRIYEEKIHHWADKMEPMDLDDGVKANYAKFQELLTKIK